MPKRQVLYRSKGELEEIKQGMEAFELMPTDDIGSYSVLVAGKEGQGKSHLACSIASSGKPVYMLDTEHKGHIVANKFGINYARISTYLDLKVAILAIMAKNEPGWIIIDSGSDIQQWAEEDYLELTKQEKVYPLFNWAEVFGRIDVLNNRMKQKGFNFIYTARMKAEYVNDKTTGSDIPHIYKRLPYMVDMVLQIHNDELYITKNGFTKGVKKKPEDILLGQKVDKEMNLWEILLHEKEKARLEAVNNNNLNGGKNGS